WEKTLKAAATSAAAAKAGGQKKSAKAESPLALSDSIDRTAKMYIGGKQVRPDSGYSRPVLNPTGALVGEVGDGNRKDIRNAVEAARAASGLATTSAHNRAQVLYFLAENHDYHADEFAARIKSQTSE